MTTQKKTRKEGVAESTTKREMCITCGERPAMGVAKGSMANNSQCYDCCEDDRESERSYFDAERELDDLDNYESVINTDEAWRRFCEARRYGTR